MAPEFEAFVNRAVAELERFSSQRGLGVEKPTCLLGFPVQ